MDWYEEDVKNLEEKSDALSYVPEMLFYGSSSIRLWDSLYQDFADYQPINLGFGGSTLEACVYFFQRIMQPYQQAKQLVIYAGDNDLGDGREPEEVLQLFIQLCEAVETFFDEIEVFYLSVKPSIARWDIHDKIKETNQLIVDAIKSRFPTIHFVNIYNSMVDAQGLPLEELYADDGLHLSAKGYEIWKDILLPCFAQHIKMHLSPQQ